MTTLPAINNLTELGQFVKRCSQCGHTGPDVTEQPTYSPVLFRDTTDYFCVDVKTCLNRQTARLEAASPELVGKYRRLA
jgi:hypothetical protein